MSRSIVILLVVVGCILLVVANVSLWITRDVLDSGRFGMLVAEGLQTDQSAEALSTLIVDHILENRPRVPSFVRRPAEEFISRLLQRPILGTVLEKAAQAADAVVTGGLAADISIDLEKVVPFVDTLLTTIAPELAEGFENAPETGPIKLLESGELPRIRQVAEILPWLWPLATIGAIVLYVLAYWRAQSRRDAALFIGLGVVITGFIALLFIPAIQLAVENNVANASVQVIVGEVMSVFTRDLFVQTVILIVIGLVILVTSRFVVNGNREAEVSEAEVSEAEVIENETESQDE
jgi:hypothetical protein